ncbi:MAG: cytidine deaminase [Luteibaculaceae bacterium]
MKEINIPFTYQEFDSIEDLSDFDKILLLEAQKATEMSYAPYSEFNVGAALRLEDGTIIHGSNQENMAFPSGLCAERVAFFHAGAMHKGKKIVAVAITAVSKKFDVKKPIFPCGACRQSMVEYEQMQDEPISIIMGGKLGKIIKVQSVKSLLPLLFHENDLKKS